MKRTYDHVLDAAVASTSRQYNYYHSVPKADFNYYDTAPKADFNYYDTAPKADFNYYDTAPKADFNYYDTDPEADFNYYDTAPEADFNYYDRAPKAVFHHNYPAPIAFLNYNCPAPKAFFNCNYPAPIAFFNYNYPVPRAVFNYNHTAPKAVFNYNCSAPEDVCNCNYPAPKPVFNYNHTAPKAVFNYNCSAPEAVCNCNYPAPEAVCNCNDTAPETFLLMDIFIRKDTDDKTNIIKTESSLLTDVTDTNINQSFSTSRTGNVVRPFTTQVPSTTILNDSKDIKAPVKMCDRLIMNPAGKVKRIMSDIPEVDNFKSYLVSIPQIQPANIKDRTSIEKCIFKALHSLPKPTTEMKYIPESQLGLQEKCRRILLIILAKLRETKTKKDDDPLDLDSSTCKLVIDSTGYIQSLLNFRTISID